MTAIPQPRLKIAAELSLRKAQHHADVRSAAFRSSSPPLNLLADGDSWFDYPLGGAIPLISRTDVIAQLPDVSVIQPLILNLAHYGDDVTTAMGLARVQKISAALDDPDNGKFDAIMFSAGGNDIVGDSFVIWLHDASDVGGDAAQALDEDRFPAVLGLVKASLLDLCGLRDDRLPGAPIFVHGYDVAIPDGRGVCPGVGPWLKPSLDYCGWTDLEDATEIVCMALTRFASMLQGVAADPANNVVYVPTQGTLGSGDWANELHPTKDGFRSIAVKFQNALEARFPGRI